MMRFVVCLPSIIPSEFQFIQSNRAVGKMFGGVNRGAFAGVGKCIPNQTTDRAGVEADFPVTQLKVE